MPYKRGISPLTTWHSQAGLLLISASWGLSYLVPNNLRIPFSEVYPQRVMNHTFAPSMHWWGGILFITAFLALLFERVIASSQTAHRAAWLIVVGSHTVLATAYATLGFAALWQAALEVHSWPHAPFWGGAVSSVSRTVLWAYIGYLHTTYARLPRPVVPEEEPEHA